MMLPNPAAGPARRSYLPQLDGWRGLAIAAVAFHHFGFHPPSWIDWGPVGPTLFFLLSGYLITISLEKMRVNAGEGAGFFGGHLIGFHARRIGRLLPIVLILLGIGIVAGLPGYRENWPWHAAFATNFLIVARGEWAGSLSHLWSLSLQEQFYLLWPLVLCLPRRFFAPALGGIIVAAVGFRLACIETGASEFARWFLLPGSLDAFAVGGLVAWLAQNERARDFVIGRWRWPTAFAAVAVLVLARVLRFLPGTHPATALIDFLEAVFFGFLLWRLVVAREGLLVRALSWHPLRFVGMVSYGIFIFHVLVGLALTHVLGEFGVSLAGWPFLRAALSFAASVGVAAASWRWLEQPINRWVRNAEFDPAKWMTPVRNGLAFSGRGHPLSRLAGTMRFFRWPALVSAAAGVWLALSWIQPEAAQARETPWSIYKTTLEDGTDEALPDFSEPFMIDNAPEIDPVDPPSA